FEPSLLDERLRTLAVQAGALETIGGLHRSSVRFSTLGDHLFVHSAFPTDAGDAVFFGPDTYRFARVLKQVVSSIEPARRLRVIDIGCGSGAGGIVVGDALGRANDPELVLADINAEALRHARVNALLNEFPDARVVHSDVLRGIDGNADLIIANPPYLVDGAKRTYRHGGGALGFDLSLRIVEEALPRLTSRGRLALYTGAAVIEGVDQFRRAVTPLLERAGEKFTYEEVDVDVFGEELDQPA